MLNLIHIFIPMLTFKEGVNGDYGITLVSVGDFDPSVRLGKRCSLSEFWFQIYPFLLIQLNFKSDNIINSYFFYYILNSNFYYFRLKLLFFHNVWLHRVSDMVFECVLFGDLIKGERKWAVVKLSRPGACLYSSSC